MLPANLPALQEKLPANMVTLLPISGADMFYTDGLASAYQYRLEIKEGGSIKYSAYINTKEFVSCNLNKTEETAYYSNIIQNWLSGANQSGANQSGANQRLNQITPPNPSLTQSRT
jgi:hypothetical protein